MFTVLTLFSWKDYRKALIKTGSAFSFFQRGFPYRWVRWIRQDLDPFCFFNGHDWNRQHLKLRRTTTKYDTVPRIVFFGGR